MRSILVGGCRRCPLNTALFEDSPSPHPTSFRSPLAASPNSDDALVRRPLKPIFRTCQGIVVLRVVERDPFLLGLLLWCDLRHCGLRSGGSIVQGSL